MNILYYLGRSNESALLGAIFLSLHLISQIHFRFKTNLKLPFGWITILLTHHAQIGDMSPNSVGWTLLFSRTCFPVKFWAAWNLFITTWSPAPSLSYSLSRWLTCTTISGNAIHILLVSAGMLLTGDVPLILQVQRKTWPRFRELRRAFAPPTHGQCVCVFNGPHRGKRLTVCLHSGISELVLIIEPLSIQRHWSQPRCLFHRSLNLCRSPNVHYSSKLARGL